MLFEDNIPYVIFKILLSVIGTLGMMCSTTKFKREVKQLILIILVYLCYVASGLPKRSLLKLYLTI